MENLIITGLMIIALTLHASAQEFEENRAVTAKDLAVFARALANAKVPAGFHVRSRDFTVPPDEAPPIPDSADGVLRLKEAFERAHPAYEMRLMTGIIVIEFKRWMNLQDNVLNTAVHHFEFDESVPVAGGEALRLLDPKLRVPRGVIYSGPPFDPANPPREDRVTVRVESGTTRAVLNAIVKAKPGAVWVWKQATATPSAEAAELSILLPNGKTVIYSPLGTHSSSVRIVP
jgi:hypothetical protein